MTTKPHTARQACRRWAAEYRGLPGDATAGPPMPRPPRAGYAWDSQGNEVKLMQGRRYLRPAEKDEHEVE